MASSFPAYVAQGIEHTTVQEFTPAAAANDLEPGSLAVVTAGVATLCGTDPTLIAGISEVSSVGAALLTPNGMVPLRILQGAGVVVAFSSSTTPVATTHIGTSYGVTKSGDIWQLDISKTTTSSRFRVVAVDVAKGIFFCVPNQNILQFADVTVATS